MFKWKKSPCTIFLQRNISRQDCHSAVHAGNSHRLSWLLWCTDQGMCCDFLIIYIICNEFTMYFTIETVHTKKNKAKSRSKQIDYMYEADFPASKVKPLPKQKMALFKFSERLWQCCNNYKSSQFFFLVYSYLYYIICMLPHKVLQRSSSLNEATIRSFKLNF